MASHEDIIVGIAYKLMSDPNYILDTAQLTPDDVESIYSWIAVWQADIKQYSERV